MKPTSKIALSLAFVALPLMGLNSVYAATASTTGGATVPINLPVITSPPPTNSMVCAEGKLNKIEHVWGAGNTVRIASESSPAPYGSYRTVPGLGEMTELNFDATATDRDKSRLNLLQLAMANKLPVQIVVWGKSCRAASDSFDITLCTDGAACAKPR